MKIFPKDEENFSFILAPLIDVMLFLLMFFMLSYFFSRNLSVHDIALPSSKNALKVQNLPDYWILDCDKGGALFLDGKLKNSQQLVKILKTTSSSEQKPLVLRADKTLSYQRVMDVMDLVKRAGVRKIYLATQN